MKHPKKEIWRLVEALTSTGDPWELSNEGIRSYDKRIEAALEALFWCLDGIENDRTRQNGFKALLELMHTVLETVETFHNVRRAATKQALIAQYARVQKAAKRRRQLFTSIQEEAKAQNRALSKGIKFAQLIRPGVRVRLGLERNGSGWPSASTIKNAIGELKSKSQRQAKYSRPALSKAKT